MQSVQTRSVETSQQLADRLTECRARRAELLQEVLEIDQQIASFELQLGVESETGQAASGDFQRYEGKAFTERLLEHVWAAKRAALGSPSE